MAVIDTPFFVTGGETQYPPTNASSASQREINIHAPFGILPEDADRWNGQKVWLLLPGFTSSPDYYDENLATAIRHANPNDTVLVLECDSLGRN